LQLNLATWRIEKTTTFLADLEQRIREIENRLGSGISSDDSDREAVG
jgi:uncharacterized lipoprotein YddW (UPF0748 family)